ASSWRYPGRRRLWQIVNAGQKPVCLQQRLPIPPAAFNLRLEEAVSGAFISNEVAAAPKPPGLQTKSFDVCVRHRRIRLTVNDEGRRQIATKVMKRRSLLPSSAETSRRSSRRS